MQARSVFKKLLGWKDVTVRDVLFDDDKDALVVMVRPRSVQMVCSGCGHTCATSHGRLPLRRWRHLDTMGMVAVVSYAPRRVKCPRCGVKVERVPWAADQARHTVEFEDLIASLAQQASKTTVTRVLRIGWRTVGDVVKRVLARYGADDPLADLRHMGVDELSYRKHHKYVTVVRDQETGRVVWVQEGKSADTLRKFFEELGKERCGLLRSVTVDMSEAYAKAIREYAPQAQLVFDRFHVQALAHKALDVLRRDESWPHDPKHTRWVLQKNPWNLTVKEHEKLQQLEEKNQRLYRGYLLKECLAGILDRRQPGVAADQLRAWIQWALESDLRPFHAVARSVERHFDGIIAYIATRMTNAAVEGTNGKIRTITRRSYGFHNVDNFISMIFLCCSGININLPFRRPSGDWVSA